MNKFNIFYNGILNIKPSEEIEIQRFLDLIKIDSPLLKQIRVEKNKVGKNKLKSKLSYVTFSGTFTKRGNENLIKSSGLCHLDIDGIDTPEDLKKAKERVAQDKFTHCAFVSPSGKGLKIVVKIPPVKNNEKYRSYWLAVAKHYGFKEFNDKAVKDISRACYLSFDTNPFFNSNSEEFTEKILEDEEEVFEETLEEKRYTRSEKEFGEVCKLIKNGKEKTEIFNEMKAFSKWSNAPQSYKELTFKKAKNRVIKISEKKNLEPEGFLIIKYNRKTGEEISKGVDIDKVADYLIQKHLFKTWFGIKTDYSFNYNGMIFERNARGVVKTESEKLLKEHCKKHIVEEIFEKIKRKTKVEKEEFEKTDTNFICLKNGVWDIKNKKLLPHNPKFHFQTFIPQIYNPNASCPKFKKFVEETLYPEDIPTMQEWFGSNLFRKYFIKKAVICVGQRNTAKTVFLDTLIKFIGEKNKSGLSLQKISSGSDFTKLTLKNKHSNVYDDLSSNDVNNGGAFKIATGGGYISAEEKFGEYQQFRSFAKICFATNKIPPLKDNDDEAYFFRWIVLKFDNVPEKINPFLREKLWTQEEMSGILNWALVGLYRLLEKGHFSYNKSAEEIKKIMEESGCPLVAFSNEVLQKENGHIISKEEMFLVYSLWCEENKKPRLTKEMLGRQMPKYCTYINSIKQKKRVWQNAKINDNWLEKLQKSVGSGETGGYTDTSDTSQNIMRKYYEKKNKDNNKVNNMVYIKSEKVSEVPTKPLKNNPTNPPKRDTRDTYSKKENTPIQKEIDFSNLKMGENLE